MNRVNLVVTIPSLEVGGAESMVYQLVTNINKNKFDLTLLVIGRKSGSEFEKIIADKKIKAIYLEKDKGLSLKTFFKVFKLFNKLRPQIVHSHLSACLYVIPWVYLNRVKLIHTLHSIPEKELPFLHRSMLKVMYKKHKAIPVAISDYIKKRVVNFYNIKDNEVEVIYNPVDVNKFNKINNKSDSNNIVYVCIARLNHIKNHKLLLKSFKQVISVIQDAQLLIIGDGELRQEIEQNILELKLEKNVYMLGIRHDIPDILANSDIFVLPSLYEGLPMTILEAMAAGKPVIATDVGGNRDIVKNNGLLVESNNIDELSKAMISLGKNREELSRMGAIGRKEVKKYDIRNITNKYEKLYEKTLGGKSDY